MIYRPMYVDKIMTYVDTPFIKILTGVRRCGKSTILKMIMEKLHNEKRIPQEQIVSYRFDSMEYEDDKSLLEDFGEDEVRFWMIQEKRKPQNLKSDIGFMILTVLALSGYDIYKGVFAWNDVWKKIVLMIVIIVFGEVAEYVYSWKE